VVAAYDSDTAGNETARAIEELLPQAINPSCGLSTDVGLLPFNSCDRVQQSGVGA